MLVAECPMFGFQMNTGYDFTRLFWPLTFSLTTIPIIRIPKIIANPSCVPEPALVKSGKTEMLTNEGKPNIFSTNIPGV